MFCSANGHHWPIFRLNFCVVTRAQVSQPIMQKSLCLQAFSKLHKVYELALFLYVNQKTRKRLCARAQFYSKSHPILLSGNLEPE